MHFHRRPRLVFRMTQRLYRTIRALRLARDAQIPPVMDHLVRVQNPPIRRDDLHQILLNLLRVIVLSELPSPRDAMHVRIDNHAHRFAEPRAQHDIGSFTSHPRKRQQLVHLLRELRRRSPQRLSWPLPQPTRLVPEESGGSHVWLQAARGPAPRKPAPWDTFANSAGVTRFTLASVDCADRMVATSSSQALL